MNERWKRTQIFSANGGGLPVIASRPLCHHDAIADNGRSRRLLELPVNSR